MMDRKAFFILACIMFLTMTGYGIVLPGLPYVAERLGLSSFEMGSLITGWALAQFIITPFWGRLIDKFGRKPVLLFGLFGFGIAFLIIIFAQSFWQLFFARVIGAILSSGSMPACLTIVADSTDDENRGAAMAQMGAVNGLGFVCGPALGGVLTPFGVDVPFIVAGSLAFIALPFAWFLIKEPKKPVLLNDEPSLFKSIFMVTTRGYRELYALTLGHALAVSSILGMLGYFMIDRFAADPVATSVGFSVFAGGSAFVQFFLLKYIYQFKSELWVTKFGCFVSAIGYLFVALSPYVWMVILGCAILGIGGAFIKPTVVAMLSKQGKMGSGITMGLDQSIDSFGRIVGPLLGGVVYSLHISLPFISASMISILLLVIVIISSKSPLGAWGMAEVNKNKHVISKDV